MLGIQDGGWILRYPWEWSKFQDCLYHPLPTSHSGWSLKMNDLCNKQPECLGWKLRHRKPAGLDSIGSLKPKKKPPLAEELKKCMLIRKITVGRDDVRLVRCRQFANWSQPAQFNLLLSLWEAKTWWKHLREINKQKLLEIVSVPWLVSVANGKCLTMFEDWNFASTVFANTRFLCLCGVLHLIQVREVVQAMTLYLHLTSCQND